MAQTVVAAARLSSPSHHAARNVSALRAQQALLLLTPVVVGLTIAPVLGRVLTGPLVRGAVAPHPVTAAFSAATLDPAMISRLSERLFGRGHLFRFTPAGSDTRPDRAVTVVVRVDGAGSRAIRVRGNPALAGAGGNLGGLRLAPMVFNLGMARGYESFSGSSTPPAPGLMQDLRRIDLPDLHPPASTTPAASANAVPGLRLVPQIQFDERTHAGHAPRTLGAAEDYQVRLGGAYRLTGNLDVSAGIRYSSDHDRLLPLSDARTDNQAVFVGTRFRF